MTTQEKINQQGRRYLASLAHAARLAWRHACEWDGIPPDTKFVAFSPDNPHAKWHDRILTELRRARAAYRAGGYEGLVIRNGRAR